MAAQGWRDGDPEGAFRHRLGQLQEDQEELCLCDVQDWRLFAIQLRQGPPDDVACRLARLSSMVVWPPAARDCS